MAMIRSILTIGVLASAAAQYQTGFVQGPLPPVVTFGQLPVQLPSTVFAPQAAYNYASNTQATAGLCLGACGMKSGTCWCDKQCTVNGDCCSDYQKSCVTAGLPPVAPSQESCINHCGLKIGSCWCDPLCVVNGDCCGDYDQICNKKATVPGTLAAPTAVAKTTGTNTAPTCKNTCGFKVENANCWCDPLCEKNGDCCTDYKQHCSTMSVPDNGTGKVNLISTAVGAIMTPEQQQQIYALQQQTLALAQQAAAASPNAVFGYTTPQQQVNSVAAQSYAQQYATWMAAQQNLYHPGV